MANASETKAKDAAPELSVSIDGQHYDIIQEGLARILNPKSNLSPSNSKSSNSSSEQSVFYNPIQQFNRDLSVLAIKAFGQDLISCKQAITKKPPRKNGKTNKASAGLEPQATQVEGNAVTPSDFVTGNRYAPTSETQNEHDPNASSEQDPSVKIPHSISTSDDGPARKKPKLEQDEIVPIQSDYNETAVSSVRIEDLTRDIDNNKDTLLKPTKFKILDALSATGLRALRYALEIPRATEVVANDLSRSATEAVRRNVEFNGLEDKIKPLTGNAVSHMQSISSLCSGLSGSPVGKYDVIDLDPYGTAVPFLDAALQAISDNGMLCVTCTDAGVWASCGYPEKSYALYGGIPIRGLHGHEGGLRLILHAIASAAARHGIAIEPLLSLSIDFYARVFVRIKKSPSEVKLLAGKTMLVFCCDSGCGAWTTQYVARRKTFISKDGQRLYKHGLAQGPSTSSQCEHCGCVTHMSGPMYGGPLHNPAFIKAILDSLPKADKSVYKTLTRIEGMLVTAREEFFDGLTPTFKDDKHSDGVMADPRRSVPELDPGAIESYPFFFMPAALAKVLRCQSPPEGAIKSALKHSGYLVTRSHIRPGSIRTNAPWQFIWEMMREWIRQRAPIKAGALSTETPGYNILHAKFGGSAKVNHNPGATTLVHDDTINSTKRSEDGDSVQGANNEGFSGQQTTARGVSVDTTDMRRNHIPVRPIIFDGELGSKESRNNPRIVRYQTNPRENWGPMTRAKAQR